MTGSGASAAITTEPNPPAITAPIRSDFANLFTPSSPCRTHGYSDPFASNRVCPAAPPASTGQIGGTPNEVGDVVVQQLERGILGVNHVAGIVELVFDIGLEVGRDRQVMHLVHALIERRREIEISRVQLDLQV